ncbi:MAG TPA: sigma-70 family RNA polymerase sigma factor [Anaerolineales bacterium]|nr:sigma-70 family RNA polymerase sigma factor [Anaerolineales bacterium]
MRINNEKTGSDTPDEALATRVARGDSAALEVLYDRYASRVMGISLKIVGDQALAEDILQETFWRVWQSAATYQSQLGAFAGWLFRIARNLSIDAYRRRNVRPQIMMNTRGEDSVPFLEEMPDPDMDVAEQAQAILANRQIRNALASLPDVQRQVIELAYFYGMTRQEIAEATGEALGTIHTRARLALQKLRGELKRDEF